MALSEENEFIVSSIEEKEFIYDPSSIMATTERRKLFFEHLTCRFNERFGKNLTSNKCFIHLYHNKK